MSKTFAFLVVLSLAAICLSLPLAPLVLPMSFETEITLQATQLAGGQLLILSQGYGRMGMDAQKENIYMNYTMASIVNGHRYNTMTTIISRYDMSPAKVFQLKRTNNGTLSCTSALLNGTFRTFNDNLNCSDQKTLINGHLVQFCNGTFSGIGLNGSMQLGIEHVAGKYIPYIAYQQLPHVNMTMTMIFSNFNRTLLNPKRYPFTIPDICNNAPRAATATRSPII